MPQTKMFDANLICPITTEMWAQIAALACVTANCNKSVLVRPMLSKEIAAAIAALSLEDLEKYQKALDRFKRQGDLKKAIKTDEKE